MGNTSAKNISLSIDQEGQTLVAGSTVTGMVRVHVPIGDDRSRVTNMEKTKLLFIGKEDVCVKNMKSQCPTGRENTLITLMLNQFLEILDKVSLDFDKAEVIEILAGVVQNFNCAYAVMILHKVPDWLRIQTVQKMIPFCKDLTIKSILVNKLSDWGRISTERDFENEISKQNNRWEE